MVDQNLLKTPLNALHKELGAKMVAFAGYEMPIQFPAGVMTEHLHTREKAGLFDVSHMGQASIVAADHEAAARALEAVTPSEVLRLGVGRQRLSVLLNDDGGILDDLMIARDRRDGRLNIVVNGACKEADYRYLGEHLPDDVRLERHDHRALLALQGPAAAAVLSALNPAAAELKFMSFEVMSLAGIEAIVTRGGYTGEDGYELSVDAADAERLARMLLENENVAPIGLGARDSLRLEAGMCLYGHDLTPEISPVEANLSFLISKRRRAEGGFPGAGRILDELRSGPARLRVGITPEGRAPAREGVEIQSLDGEKIGVVTSGGFGPSVGGPVAMGYVDAAFSHIGATVQLMIRGKPAPAHIVDMPFTPNRYYRGN